MSFWDIASTAATIAAGVYGGPMMGALAGAGIAGLRGQDPLMGGVSGYLSGMGGQGMSAAADKTAQAAMASGTSNAAVNQTVLSQQGILGPSAINPTTMTGMGGIGNLPAASSFSGAGGIGNFGNVQNIDATIGGGNLTGYGGNFNSSRLPIKTPVPQNLITQPPVVPVTKPTVPAFMDTSKAVDATFNPNKLPPLETPPNLMKDVNNFKPIDTTIGADMSVTTDVPLAEQNRFINQKTGFPDFTATEKFNAVIDNPQEFLRNYGDGNMMVGAGKAGLATLPMIASAFPAMYEQGYVEPEEDNRFRGPEGQLNLSGDTGLRLKGGGIAKPNSANPGRLNFGMAKALNNMQVTDNNTGAMVDTAGMSPDEIFKRYYRNKNKFSGPKFEEGGDVGGGVTGISSLPGLPIASGVTGAMSETISGPGGTETFSSMVARGVHPANAAAMLGMDAAPYLDTGPGMEFTGTPSTSPVRSGIGTLPPPPTPFIPEPGFDYEDYKGGYMEPLGGKTPVGMDPGAYGVESAIGYPSPVGPGITKSRFEEMIRKGYASGGYLQGPGDGMSDSLPAMIGNNQPAALSEGEFVVPADVVSHLGNGSSNAGSKRLYAMMDDVRQARTGTEKQGKEIKPERFMPA